MDINIARQAADILSSLSWELREKHGIEVAPGFFVIYNTDTGQSKACILHEESGFIFKTDHSAGRYGHMSGMRFEDVTVNGMTYGVRLPIFHDFSNALGIMAQEYINGESCNCGEENEENFYRCDHRGAIRDVTGCNDTHRGNWKFQGNDIVLFDFDGIRV